MVNFSVQEIATLELEDGIGDLRTRVHVAPPGVQKVKRSHRLLTVGGTYLASSSANEALEATDQADLPVALGFSNSQGTNGEWKWAVI